MKPKERMLAAFELREPDRIPAAELGIEGAIEKAIIGSLEEVKGRVEDGEAGVWLDKIDNPFWGVKRSKQAAEVYIRNLYKVVKRLDLDALVFSVHSLMPFKQIYIDENNWIDEWAAIWGKGMDGTGNMRVWYRGGTLKTEEDMERFKEDGWPDPYELGAIDTMVHAIKYCQRLAGDELMIIPSIHDGWEFALMARGFESFLMDLYKNPRLNEELLEATTRFNLELAKAIVDECKVDVIGGSDDIADARGPYMPPRLFYKHILPYYKNYVQSLKKKGIFVMRHTDGNILPILDGFVEAGLDILHPIEPVMDIGVVKEKYGDKLCLCGHIDCVQTLVFGTPEDVTNEVKQAIKKAAPGGGYILGSSNSLHSSCKIENILAMFEAGKKYGCYPIE